MKLLWNPIKGTERSSPYDRNLLWLFILLVVFEGALRKWVLPSMSNELLIVRDPIALLLLIQGIRKRWLWPVYTIPSCLLGLFCLIQTLTDTNVGFTVAYFGSRIWYLYVPCFFVAAGILTRDDVFRILRFFVYLSLPMTVLVLAQYNSPQSSWVNLGVGADESGSGFSPVEEHYRPAAIFSFTAVYVTFQAFVLVGIVLFLVERSVSARVKMPFAIIVVAVIAYIVSIPVAISRQLVFQTVGILLFAFVVQCVQGRNLFRMIGGGVLFAIVAAVLLHSDTFNSQIGVLQTRFEQAEESEGDILKGTLYERYVLSMARGLDMTVPRFGNGIGTSTRVGLNLLADKEYAYEELFVDEEWPRMIKESGELVGGALILLRVLLTVHLLIIGLQSLFKRDSVPIMLFALVLLLLPNSNWGLTNMLGFCVLSACFMIAARRTQ